MRENFGFDDDTIYLSPAPLYHGAPLRFTLRTLESGGTVVVMPKFDAEPALRGDRDAIAVTHSQWVPTMFFRLLALPEEVRGRYDLSVASLRHSRRGALPAGAQGADDRLVGADRLGILRRLGAQRRDLHFDRTTG